MLDVSELFTKVQNRAQKFIGRSDLSALAQIAAGSYVRARERTGRLMASLNMQQSDETYNAIARELEGAENTLLQALIEYTAVLRAMGDDEAVMRIGQSVETQSQFVGRRAMQSYIGSKMPGLQR